MSVSKGVWMFRYIFSFLLIFMAGCTKQADIDYNPSFKTASLSTFAIIQKNHSSISSLNEERINEAIVNNMQQKGYLNVPENAANFHINYKVKIQKDASSNVSVGLGLGFHTRGLGLGLGTAQNTTITKLNIQIDMIDPKTYKTFWSTSITDDIHEFKSPQESIEYFNKIVAVMLKEFPLKSTQSKEILIHDKMK